MRGGSEVVRSSRDEVLLVHTVVVLMLIIDCLLGRSRFFYRTIDFFGSFKLLAVAPHIVNVSIRILFLPPHSSSWSPAIDQQAMDRAHRFGQKKEVVVYRLISHASIEDKMFRVQVFKQGLLKTALEKENQMRYFNTSELKSLFSSLDEDEDVESSTLKLLHQDDGPEGALRKLSEDVGELKDDNGFWKLGGVEGFGEYASLFQEVEEKGVVQKQDEQQAQEVGF